MRKRGLIVFVFCLVLLVTSVTALDFFSLRMNFPPGESRVHNITLTNNDNFSVSVNITKPTDFTLGGSGGCVSSGGTKFICNISINSSTYVEFSSPSSCNEGDRYTSTITSNASFSDQVTFVCIPDSKIIDHKIEYGHGDANYLSDPYIANESSTLFNLIRIFNIGHYLSPNEDAENVSILCTFENYTVRTYGRTEISYNGSQVLSNFSWDSIEGGYWFRIGVVGQDFTTEPLGYTYNVSCSELTYDFDKHRVVVPNLTYSLEVRSCKALQVNFAEQPEDYSTVEVTLKNIEKYTLFDLFFEKIVGGISEEEHIIQLFPNETATYVIDRNNTYNFSFHFIPAWYRNSRNPQYCVQNFYFNGTMAPIVDATTGGIPDITFQEDTVYSGLDLDDYVSDPNHNDSSLTWNASSVDNLTIVIDNVTHVVNITPDTDFYGNRTVTFNVTDPDNLSDNQSILVTVLPVNDIPYIDPAIPTYLRAPGSGSFTIDLGVYENDVDDADENLTWSVLGVDDVCINVTINTTIDNATITPLSNLACQDIITFILSDDDNLSDQQEVEIRFNGTMELLEGWNLISFPPLTNMSVVSVLYPLGNGNYGCGRGGNVSICNVSDGDFNGTWNSVQTFNTSSGEFLVFNPTDYYLTIPSGQEFQNFNVLKGYWIEMNQNDTLELNFG